ncbi:COP23 domain-containing protein [Crocosphaera sp.]|uniref:COP23 domain-containing protein n=1 Tax=Crocosphaera sp. TaxID=2729996 RepID=UPI0026279E96|nr:COP23 domain-containing protein [Crocosphaera sp.]MDJ0581643.1 COP23 domain-containing protein [Crocosphaera sp.]
MILNYTKLLPKIVALSLIALGFNVPSVNSQGESDIFRQGEAYYCDKTTYEHPNLIFRSDLGNIRLIEFQTEEFVTNKKPPFTGTDWTPLNRCLELADRGMEFDRKGIISHLTVEEMENGIMAICISKEDADHLQLLELGGKDYVRLFITLKRDDNPKEVLEKIKGISGLARRGEEGPLIH